MTVSNQTNKINYIGNGVTTEFAIPFRFYTNSDIKVYQLEAEEEKCLVLNADYTITGGGSFSNGGTLIMKKVPEKNVQITVLRVIPMTQEVDYRENEIFPAKTHEMALAKLTMQVQQNAEKLTRTLTLSVTSDGNPDEVIPEIFNAKACVDANAKAAEVSVKEVYEYIDSVKSRGELVIQEAKAEADRAVCEADRAVLATDGKAGISLDNLSTVGQEKFNAKAPFPKESGGIGQWALSTNGVLPSGGTWAHFYLGFTGGGSIASGYQKVGIAAGGTLINSNSASAMLCWRIA